MQRKTWFKWILRLTLGAMVVLLGVAGSQTARPVSAGQVPSGPGAGTAAVQSPSLGSFINIRTNDSIDNWEPVVAYNSTRGEYLVVWWDDDSAVSTQAIYAQRIDSKGAPVGSQPITVAYYAGHLQWQPDVVYNPTHDEYLVTYTYEAGPGDWDIWATRLAWDGSAAGPDIWINNATTVQQNPAVAYDSKHDEYLVVWESEQGPLTRDIWGQRVDSAGTPQGGAVCIATSAGDLRTRPDVAYNPAQDNYLIAYTYQDDAAQDGDIFAKVAPWNLGPLSGEIEIIYNVNLQDDVALTAGGGEYLAVWQDGPGSSWRTIYGRRINGDGSIPAAPFVIAEHANLSLSAPDVSYSAGYGYLVSWDYGTGTTSSYDIYGRYVMPGQDQACGKEFGIDVGSDRQIDPAVACNPIGDCLVVYGDDYPVYGEWEIRGRFVIPYHVYLPLTLRN